MMPFDEAGRQQVQGYRGMSWSQVRVVCAAPEAVLIPGWLCALLALKAVPERHQKRREVNIMSAPTTLPIYLDYHATTPVDPRVAAIVLRVMTADFGNANSQSTSTAMWRRIC